MGAYSLHSHANKGVEDMRSLNSPLLVVVDIDNLLLPVSSIDLALEQDVDLTVRAALHLREMEVCCDQTQEACSAPDVTALAAD